ncbi:histidine phosphatase family protein [Sporosarcina sp. FA9]|uniref:histidine phosphatase family protein n=1 Tax=Sporosarcina sp. FA9 TaxID=3413030 RepID=UPI003F659484
MDNSYCIHLIRHLPTAGNKKRQYIGWTDEPILEPDCDFKSTLNVSKLYGSDLLRAKQTAEVYFSNIFYNEDCAWRECYFGEFEGKTYAHLESDLDYRNWIDDPYGKAPRGGESLLEVEARIVPALMKVPDQSVVVTHGGPIRILLTLFSFDEKEFWSWEIPHGSCFRLEWESEKAFQEGKKCTSILAVPITANERM